MIHQSRHETCFLCFQSEIKYIRFAILLPNICGERASLGSRHFEIVFFYFFNFRMLRLVMFTINAFTMNITVNPPTGVPRMPLKNWNNTAAITQPHTELLWVFMLVRPWSYQRGATTHLKARNWFYWQLSQFFDCTRICLWSWDKIAILPVLPGKWL